MVTLGRGKIFRRVGKFVSLYEKIILALLSVVIVTSGTLWYRQFAASQGDGPTVGGSYVEGIVGSQKDINSIATKLTKAGLFTINQDGQLQNLLIDQWSANPEKTEYTFHLKPGVNGDEIATTLQDQVDVIGPADVELLENNELAVDLVAPDPSLPLLLSRPLFNYGPYRISKTNAKTTVFTRSTSEFAAPAYINKVVIHTFGDEDELKAAIKQTQLDGAELPTNYEAPESYVNTPIGLNRYFTVLFNINKAPFRDPEIRRKLIDGTAVTTAPFSLVVADQEPQKTMAQEVVSKWQALGASVSLDVRPKEEFLNKVGPTRDFQAILIGLDYGAGLDPYYLWHSSQLRPPGNNLSGVNSPTIDSILDAIRNTLDLQQRHKLIEDLHMAVHETGVGLIIRQETFNYLVSDDIRFENTWLAVNGTDRFNSLPTWSVK